MRRPTFKTNRAPLPCRSLIVLGVALSVALAGCDRESEPKPRPKVAAQEGFKYYVGGPIIQSDQYGRNRLSGFNGTIMQPTNRGLLVGVKMDKDRNFEFRTWLNGALAQLSTGFIRDDGTYWYRERRGYDAAGTLVTKRAFEYDDEAEVMTTVVTYYDTDDGTVLEERTLEMPYKPPPFPVTAKQKERRAERREKRADKRVTKEAEEGTP